MGRNLLFTTQDGHCMWNFSITVEEVVVVVHSGRTLFELFPNSKYRRNTRSKSEWNTVGGPSEICGCGQKYKTPRSRPVALLLDTLAALVLCSSVTHCSKEPITPSLSSSSSSSPPSSSHHHHQQKIKFINIAPVLDQWMNVVSNTTKLHHHHLIFTSIW